MEVDFDISINNCYQNANDVGNFVVSGNKFIYSQSFQWYNGTMIRTGDTD